jgi:hypothetical protein
MSILRFSKKVHDHKEFAAAQSEFHRVAQVKEIKTPGDYPPMEEKDIKEKDTKKKDTKEEKSKKRPRKQVKRQPMALHLSEKLTKLGELQGADAYQTLVNEFIDFLGYYYTASSPVDAKEPTDDAEEVAKLGWPELQDPFLLKLLNNAASEAHEYVLTISENMERPKEGHPFLRGFEKNKEASRATTVQHVANLRRAYEIFKSSEILNNIRLHASNPSQHFVFGFGKYINMEHDILEALRLITGEEREQKGKLDEIAQKIFATPNLAQFTAKRKELLDPLGEARYKQESKKLSDTAQGRVISGLKTKKDATAEVEAEWKSSRNVTFAHLQPQTRKSLLENKLRSLYQVYSIIETVRDQQAGAINMLVHQEGFPKDKETPMNIDERLNTYNVMSPEGVNRDTALKTAQYTAISSDLAFAGPITAAYQKFLHDFAAIHEAAKEDPAEQIKALEQQFVEFLAGHLSEYLHGKTEKKEKEEEIKEPSTPYPSWYDNDETMGIEKVIEKADEEKKPKVLTGEQFAGRLQRMRWIFQTFQLGHARGRGNNCLIDTMIQLGWEKYADNEMIAEVREELESEFNVEEGGMLDFYGNEGQALINYFGVPVQVIQVTAGGQILIHPVMVPDEPTTTDIHYILHQGLHFTPLSRRDGKGPVPLYGEALEEERWND